jgi:hypothetical protein
MLGTKMLPEISLVFNQLTHLLARDFIHKSRDGAQDFQITSLISRSTVHPEFKII